MSEESITEDERTALLAAGWAIDNNGDWAKWMSKWLTLILSQSVGEIIDGHYIDKLVWVWVVFDYGSDHAHAHGANRSIVDAAQCAQLEGAKILKEMTR